MNEEALCLNKIKEIYMKQETQSVIIITRTKKRFELDLGKEECELLVSQLYNNNFIDFHDEDDGHVYVNINEIETVYIDEKTE